MTVDEVTTQDAAIRALLGRAAWVGDDGPLDDYEQVYAPNAEWRLGDDVRHGLAEIVAGAQRSRSAGVAGPGSGIRHHATVLTVDIEGDLARAHSYFLLVNGTGSGLEFPMFGRYEDSLQRFAGGWLITSRQVIAGT